MSYTPIVPPTRSSKPAADIQGFFDLVGQAVALEINAQKLPTGIQPQYVHSVPKDRLSKPDAPFDVITYRVADSMLAATTNDGLIPIAPRVFERRPAPNLSGYNLVTAGWVEETSVIFTVYSQSNENADWLTLWFHKLLIRYANAYKFFLGAGIEKFRFLKRFEDDTETLEDQELYRRKLAYTFRVQYLDSYLEKTLQTATLDVNSSRTTETDTIQLPVTSPITATS